MNGRTKSLWLDFLFILAIVLSALGAVVFGIALGSNVDLT